MPFAMINDTQQKRYFPHFPKDTGAEPVGVPPCVHLLFCDFILATDFRWTVQLLEGRSYEKKWCIRFGDRRNFHSPSSAHTLQSKARVFAHARFRAFSYQCLSVVFRESSVKLGNVSRGSDMNFGRASTSLIWPSFLTFWRFPGSRNFMKSEDFAKTSGDFESLLDQSAVR